VPAPRPHPGWLLLCCLPAQHSWVTVVVSAGVLFFSGRFRLCSAGEQQHDRHLADQPCRVHGYIERSRSVRLGVQVLAADSAGLVCCLSWWGGESQVWLGMPCRQHT
jgi:hypothetical protein